MVSVRMFGMLFSTQACARIAALALLANTALAVNYAHAQDAGMTMDMFLDRLMMAESGGRVNAKNPLSTAVGPFQFIASTWLQVARKAFGDEAKDLAPHQILELRLDPAVARKAARIYTEENAAFLAARDLPATYPNLRLAFLVGPGGAARVLTADAETPVATLLGPTVIGANPFMRTMSAGALVARAARDIAVDPGSATQFAADPLRVASFKAEGSKAETSGDAAIVAKPTKRARPRIEVECDLSRPSCKRWLFLAERRLSRKTRRAEAN